MTNEAMAALEAELLRQDAAFSELNVFLGALGDVELHVHAAFLEELDDIAKRCVPKPTETINGLRA